MKPRRGRRSVIVARLMGDASTAWFTGGIQKGRRFHGVSARATSAPGSQQRSEKMNDDWDDEAPDYFDRMEDRWELEKQQEEDDIREQISKWSQKKDEECEAYRREMRARKIAVQLEDFERAREIIIERKGKG